MWAGANAIKREREKRASRCGAGVIFQELGIQKKVLKPSRNKKG